jgi:hypothetical protein
MIKFIKENYIALGVAVILYVVYLQFTFAGNRICDCETTEKYAPGRTSGHRTGVTRFYHK